MAKQNATDQLQRRQSRNAAADRLINQEAIRKRQIRSWIILVAVVLAALLGVHFLRRYGKGKEIGMNQLPCYSSQNVTPFRDGMVYYDGASLHHLSSTGTIRWSFPAGEGVKFFVGPAHLAVWSGTQLYLVDQDGNATYNESLEGQVQFARVGERYAAVVIGDDTDPKLIVKDMILRRAGRVSVDAGARHLRLGAKHDPEHVPGRQDEHGRGFAGRGADVQGAV